jgi:hypothetical protein
MTVNSPQRSRSALLDPPTDRYRGTARLFTLPEVAWELSLGDYLIVKGVKSAPILTPTAV